MKKKEFNDPNREYTEAEFMCFLENAVGFEMVEQRMLDVMENLRHLNGPTMEALSKLLCHVRERCVEAGKGG